MNIVYRGYQIVSLKKQDVVSRRIGRYSIDDSHELLHIGKELVNGYKDTMNEKLSVLLDHEDGVVDGELLEAFSFPKIDAEVFISHSQADVELSTMLAGRLKRDLDITFFVDSNVWGYRDKMIEVLAQCSKGSDDNESKGRLRIAAHLEKLI